MDGSVDKKAPQSPGTAVPWSLHATAFLGGLAVMVVEIAGARSLAPFFGSSLQVWTAQITATLLFLALGYRLGGWLAEPERPWTLSLILLIPGLWLSAYGILRMPVLTAASAAFSIPLGSFLSASVLFGLPLTGLGSLSPLLIGRARRSAASAAGSLFFTGTLGSLVGGWLTALVLIPHSSLRWSLMGTGLGLLGLAAVWALVSRIAGRSQFKNSALALLVALGLAAASPRPARSLGGLGKGLVRVLESRQSSVGLLQVLDQSDLKQRTFCIDGVTQGGMSTVSGRSFLQFTESMNYFAWRYHPQARKALALGLGCGVLAKGLAARGLDVTVAELEPAVLDTAKRWFDLPGSVQVVLKDGRTFLNQDTGKYDLIFLDAFAGETVPFYLCTREAMQRVQERLALGGRLLVNTITRKGSATPGFQRLESALARAFPQGLAFVDRSEAGGPEALTNATLVAGAGLQAAPGRFPGPMEGKLLAAAEAMAPSGEAVRDYGLETWDEASDLDLVESSMRLEWRRALMNDLGPELLSD
jgi:predicted membrane-bound spermidine synthase